RQVLRKSVDRIYAGSFDTNSGYGRINAGNALALGPVLQSRILGPARESTVEGAVVITGVAQGASFSGYTLDYGAGDDPADWLPLLATNSAVDHATLGTFDTSGLADGRYTVRQRASDSFSAVFED